VASQRVRHPAANEPEWAVSFASLVVIDREGRERTVRGEVGLSIMEILREEGFEEIAAICGGCCSCATCHVYVDPDFESILPRISADENELLSGSEHRTGSSRLSCQLRLAEDMNGMIVTISPEG